MPHISIIVSLYRTETHLARFLHEAKSMSKELDVADVKHEFVLVANDATPEERKFLDTLELPFKIIHVPREPIYASWNRGVRESQGEFLTFWGVDDTRYASAIVEGLKNFETTNADIVYFPFRYHRFIKILGLSLLAKVKTFIPPEFDKDCFQKEMHLGPHFMVRRSLLDKIGLFDETFNVAGDFEFQTRATNLQATFSRVLSISGIFRNDGTTLSGSRAALHSEENKLATK